MLKILPVFILIALGVLSVWAQKVYTPAKGSAERTTILNALRVPFEKELKQKIQFAADNFNVQGNWAFVSGAPQTMDGETPEYSGTQYKEAIEAEMFDNNFFALLKKTGEKWKVVTYLIGCTDVCYLPWVTDYKAPKGIFPYTE